MPQGERTLRLRKRRPQPRVRCLDQERADRLEIHLLDDPRLGGTIRHPPMRHHDQVVAGVSELGQTQRNPRAVGLVEDPRLAV